MTENDLVLNVKVFDSNNKEVASFSHDIGVIVPDGAFEHSDAIAPKKLPGGKYQISASVMQGDMEVSNDTANITVGGINRSCYMQILNGGSAHFAK